MSIKNTFFLATSFFFLVGLTSCEVCKECTYTQTIKSTGMQDVVQTVNNGETCGEDLKNVDGETFTSTQTVGGIDQEITQVWNCE